MPRTPGPDPIKISVLRGELTHGPLHIRDLARRVSGHMSYHTVYRYLHTHLLEEVEFEGRYGPNWDHLLFVRLKTD